MVVVECVSVCVFYFGGGVARVKSGCEGMRVWGDYRDWGVWCERINKRERERGREWCPITPHLFKIVLEVNLSYRNK